MGADEDLESSGMASDHRDQPPYDSHCRYRCGRLEWNLHDGAKQQLVALSVKLNLVKDPAGRDPRRDETLLDDLKAEATDALENLRGPAGHIPALSGLRCWMPLQPQRRWEKRQTSRSA